MPKRDGVCNPGHSRFVNWSCSNLPVGVANPRPASGAYSGLEGWEILTNEEHVMKNFRKNWRNVLAGIGPTVLMAGLMAGNMPRDALAHI